MKADLLIRGISQLVTPPLPGPRHGAAMRNLSIIGHAALAIAQGTFLWAGPEAAWAGESAATLDLQQRAVVPGLVDPHTHAVWAGDRLADFQARLSGASYEKILASGGGIWSTIRATAAATHDELLTLARSRIAALTRTGATVIEVKSGYGFEPEAEIALLGVIHALALSSPARIIPTLLIHVPPADPGARDLYLARICDELVPKVADLQLAHAVDVFVEREAWRAAEAERIFAAARRHRLAIKLHTEQFHSVGGLELGLRLGALSVDHLEACSAEQVHQLSGSPTVATLLPGVSLHLGLPPAPGRRLIDAGAAVALGTDLNPGSSPVFSAALPLALAVRLNGLTAAEALVAATVNAAAALDLRDAGRIAPGLTADFLVLESADWRDLIYTLGANPVREVWIGGRPISV